MSMYSVQQVQVETRDKVRGLIRNDLRLREFPHAGGHAGVGLSAQQGMQGVLYSSAWHAASQSDSQFELDL